MAASVNAAQAIGEKALGRIEVGNPADLVMLDEKLNVQATIVAGRLIHWSREFANRVH